MLLIFSADEVRAPIGNADDVFAAWYPALVASVARRLAHPAISRPRSSTAEISSAVAEALTNNSLTVPLPVPYYRQGHLVKSGNLTEN